MFKRFTLMTTVAQVQTWNQIWTLKISTKEDHISFSFTKFPLPATAVCYTLNRNNNMSAERWKAPSHIHKSMTFIFSSVLPLKCNQYANCITGYTHWITDHKSIKNRLLTTCVSNQCHVQTVGWVQKKNKQTKKQQQQQQRRLTDVHFLKKKVLHVWGMALSRTVA